MMQDIISHESEKAPYDVEVLHKCNLFTPAEIRNIRKSRNDFDYKINNSSRSARSFLEYIAYERGLLLQVNEKRRANESQEFTIKETKKLVEQLIIQKIIKLYKEALAHYQNEERIYEHFFKFCKIAKRSSEVLPYMVKCLEIHGGKPEVWIVAALWEYEELKHPQKARAIFKEALSRHPQSTEIYKAFIKTELMEASTLNNSVEENSISQQSTAVKKILEIYIHSKKDIFDLQFLVDLLDMLEEYNFSNIVQNEIVRDLVDLFPAYELTWHTLAQRELKGYHINDSLKPVDSSVNDSGQVSSNIISPESGMLTPKIDKDSDLIPNPYTKLTLKRRIELCTKIYYKGAQIIKTPVMWTYYINAMIDLNADMSTQAKLKYKCLLTAFKLAQEASVLTEGQFLQYIEILKRSTDPDESEHLLLAVLDRATRIYSSSVNLWSMYLKYFIKQNNELKTREKFHIAVKKCGRDSLPLWELFKQYLYIVTSIEDKKKVDAFFLEALKQPEPISSCFKVEYIDWLSFTRGVNRARQIFYSLINKSPSYQLHKKMLEINKQLVVHKIIEEQIEDDNFKETRKCYDLALVYFGKTKIELWIDYIKFEKDFGDIKEMKVLLAKGKLELDPIYLDAFVSQYDLLNLIL